MARIYVACLADYNNGHLHGVWIDDCTDRDTIESEIATMLRGSKYPNVMVECPCHDTNTGSLDSCPDCKGIGKVPSAEEWAIHDHEGFEGIKIGENQDLDNVVLHATMLDKHDGAWAAYISSFNQDGTEESFQDEYQGSANSPEDYAENLYSEIYDLKDNPLLSYVDWERVARDLGYDGYSFERDSSGTLHVFRNA